MGSIQLRKLQSLCWSEANQTLLYINPQSWKTDVRELIPYKRWRSLAEPQAYSNSTEKQEGNAGSAQSQGPNEVRIEASLESAPLETDACFGYSFRQKGFYSSSMLRL